MAHFAKIDENNVVIEVIVADKEFIDSGIVGEPDKWIQTSYNTRGGIYYTPNTNDPDIDQSKALRKNFAGIGYTYYEVKDAFIPPKLLDSWILNENSCLWEAPIPYPTDGKTYYWDEEALSWIEAEVQ